MPKRPFALTPDLIARAHPDPVEDDASALRVLADAELHAGLTRHLGIRRSEQEGIWVFAYGSLLWQPEFESAEQRLGRLHGYHRRFCLLQRRFRGSPARPGLVLGLERGGSCRGLVFRLVGADPHALLLPVWRREMLGMGYLPLWSRVATALGPITALTFAVNRASDRYTGRLDEPAIADLIATGCGHLGPSAEYLLKTLEACRRLGIHDRHLWAMQALVAERLQAVP